MRLIVWTGLLAGCAPGTSEPPTSVAAELGLDRYRGTTEAASEEEVDGVTTTTFTTQSGPRCLRGEPFRAATREGASDDLLIFLQGGGACWSQFCLAVTKAPPGMPTVDVLDPTLPWNPFRDHDVAYAPYCDASLFSGDTEIDEDGDGVTDRYHRGLANLSATLDLAQERFPSPPRVVLSGSSGGAYGTILGAILVRSVFPDAEVVLLADSGTGVARGSSDPSYVRDLLDEIGASGFLPPDCPDCLADGNVTGVLDWWMQQDTALRVGVFSSWYDSIIGDVFLQLPPATFRDELASATSALHAAYPDRYRRFVVDGRMHTTLLGDPTGIIGSDLGAVELPPNALSLFSDLALGSLETTAIGEAKFSTWVEGLLDADTEVWVDLTEPAGPAPE